MNIALSLLALTVGYLLGAVSFARLALRRFAPDQGVRPIEMRLPGENNVITSDAVSATTVRVQLGARFGCATALLDMLKVAVPTLFFATRFPGDPYFLMAAAAGVAGHNWPVYHGFRGGRGVSPIIGGMLVIDPLGIVVTVVSGAILGRYVLRNYVFMTGGYLILLLPWLWWRTGDPWHLAYGAAINVLGWTARRPELRQYAQMKREGRLPPIDQIADFLTGRAKPDDASASQANENTPPQDA